MPPLRPPPFRRQLNIDVEEQFILLLSQGKSLRDAFEYIYEFKHHPITTYFPQFFILENVVRDSISLSASKQLTNEKINNLTHTLMNKNLLEKCTPKDKRDVSVILNEIKYDLHRIKNLKYIR